MFERTTIRRNLASLLLATTITAGLAGCSLRDQRGTFIGAGVGVLAGAVIDRDEPARGALIGGTIGALGGYAIAHDHEDDRYRGRGYRSRDDRDHRHRDRRRYDRYDDCDY